MPVVLVAYGGGHVAMLAPVARSLLQRGHAVVFLALTTAGAYLERVGIPCIGYRHLPEAGRTEVAEWGRQLTRELAPGGAVPLEESIAYMGLNYRELVEEHGPEDAARLFAEKGRQAFCPVAMFKRWFAELRPSLVMATNSPRSEQAALQAAGELGIASICAVDLFAMQEIQWIRTPGYASRICVLNEQVRDMFVAQGCRADSVVVTGNPAFERLQQPEVREAGRALRAAKGWGTAETVVLWASQVEPERHPFTALAGDPTFPRRIEASLREFVSAHEQYRLVVRYHPSERVEFQAGQGRVELSPSSEDLATLLHAVDVVVVATSTVGLEACLAGRAVLSVKGSMFTPDAPYGQMGIATEVASAELLGQALSSIDLQAVVRPDELPERSEQLSPTEKLVAVIDALLEADGVLRQG
ncbi:UDP-glycosyltransferase [Pseudomonas sp. MAFF212428]|uniref:UDP-glycosyltransferase n=1 Tax=Pseudomonas brassicae TaxID=2708063 RepID=A0A6B3NRY6_9PSED|nr:UDP-glycosyltransferase [Pseudomonas brassicae]NER58842.1 UDP-glycosyltransferase [Pseudomonas brassicae]NER64676.1 UDP-glycosyltransferase [Pseudomonas brassicae]